jgi:uroporphyrin-III C-methyltransferase
MAAGEAAAWMDPVQPSLLMIGEALADRATESVEEAGADEPHHERAA